MKKIGVIAGNRRFPIVLCEEAKKKKAQVFVAAIKKETSPSIKKFADRLLWFDLGDFQRMVDFFVSYSVKEVILAGQISPWRLFSKEVQTNPQLRQFLSNLKDWRANSIFQAIVNFLESKNLTVLPSTSFLEDYLPSKGVLTKNQPDEKLWQDINFGFEVAKKIATLDIGLSVGVKDKAIVAVEALEGTDNLILRAGKITRKGVIIVKVARPHQDMRFDIPVIGLKTILTLKKAKASGLAIEAEKTLILDLSQCIYLCNRLGIWLVAV
ncbi:MAG: UDP-2,3-diacylglucosamine diphosphatase LpxI [Candidatus Omnitrophica bacterium]|nr:UDP-2,3-diacylglucosamine diphosphatase LpxI [Candidatus Omnitrophota bacterium]